MRLVVDLDSWVYQADGNYRQLLDPDVDTAEFALHLRVEEMSPSNSDGKSLACIGGAYYSYTGEVIFVAADREMLVLDVGILVYVYIPVPESLDVHIGEFVSGSGHLVVDEFYYVSLVNRLEYKQAFAGFPDLVYSWRLVDRVEEGNLLLTCDLLPLPRKGTSKSFR